MKTFHTVSLLSTLLIGLMCQTNGLAQTPTLCDIYSSLIKESQNGFLDLRGEVISNVNGHKKIASSNCIPGAVSCYIDSDKYQPAWIAEFGAFETLEKAQVKIKELQDKMVACGSTLKFISCKGPGDLPYYYMKENTDGGFYVYNGQFEITKNNDSKYVPAIRMPYYASPLDFMSLTNEPDSTLFTRELGRMIKEAKSNFDNIEGTKIKVGDDVTYYNTTFCITGTRCRIEDDLFRTCRILVLDDVPQEKEEKAIRKTAELVASALGKNYLVSTDGAYPSIYFTHISQISPSRNETIEVTSEIDDDETYCIIIRVSPPPMFR